MNIYVIKKLLKYTRNFYIFFKYMYLNISLNFVKYLHTCNNAIFSKRKDTQLSI